MRRDRRALLTLRVMVVTTGVRRSRAANVALSISSSATPANTRHRAISRRYSSKPSSWSRAARAVSSRCRRTDVRSVRVIASPAASPRVQGARPGPGPQRGPRAHSDDDRADDGAGAGTGTIPRRARRCAAPPRARAPSRAGGSSPSAGEGASGPGRRPSLRTITGPNIQPNEDALRERVSDQRDAPITPGDLRVVGG